MSARAIWKGILKIGRYEVGVKMYSALRTRPVDFRLLHKTDLEPVHQRIVRKSDGAEIPAAERRKALQLDGQRAVILQNKELVRLEPRSSRSIATCEFVAPEHIAEQWYDQPYFLGPDSDQSDYFALVTALATQDVFGVIRWTMRKRRYLGALMVDDGRLLVMTLRRADQLIELPKVAMPALAKEELRLAEQLVKLASDDFDPALWKDGYRQRLSDLVEAKRRGKTKKLAPPRQRSSRGTLSAQLRLSLQRAKEGRRA